MRKDDSKNKQEGQKEQARLTFLSVILDIFHRESRVFVVLNEGKRKGLDPRVRKDDSKNKQEGQKEKSKGDSPSLSFSTSLIENPGALSF